MAFDASHQTSIKMKPGRLKKRPEFLAVNAAGHKWVSGTVIVQYKPRCQSDSPDKNPVGIKYGVTATKRIGNAVIRNRCKRRLRAAIGQITCDTTLVPCDIVLIARDKTADCPWDDLIRDLRWCLKRLNLIQPAQS